MLLHGFGGDLNNWLFNTDRLAERRRVYALDLPGHGESSKDVGAGDLDAFAETLGGFLDAVGAARAHLVGHSMGGAVALAYALDHPDRVASLTLVAAAGLGEDIDPDYIDGFVAAERRRELKGVLELLFADQGLVSRKLVDDVLRYKRLDGVDAALRTVAGAMYPRGARRWCWPAGWTASRPRPWSSGAARTASCPPPTPRPWPAGPGSRSWPGPATHPTWRPPTRSTAWSAASWTSWKGKQGEIRSRGDAEVTTRAERELPEKLDAERDADLLRRFDVDPAALLEGFGGQSPEVG